MENKNKQPTWDILIPTIENRFEKFKELCNELNRQIKENNLSEYIDILEFSDKIGENVIGAKRNYLLESSNAEYVCFIDDDDIISETYIKDIYNCLLENVDCVTFNGEYYVNGLLANKFNIRVDNSYIEKDGILLRPINHLCPIKRSIALKAKYPDTTSMEDFTYTMRLKQLNINFKESFIDKALYKYMYLSEKDTTQIQKSNSNQKIKNQIELSKKGSDGLTNHQKNLGYGRPIKFRQ